jgi:hypothetical protein
VRPEVAALVRRLAGLLAEIALGSGGADGAAAIQTMTSQGPSDGSLDHQTPSKERIP